MKWTVGSEQWAEIWAQALPTAAGEAGALSSAHPRGCLR
jgi:hypothetical protein